MAVIKIPVSKHRRATRGQDSKQKGDRGEARSNEWDNVCAFCDDGGHLLCCDGGCLRSFHPTKRHGEHSLCATLGLTEEQWQILKPKEHEEVFQCKDQKCGHFYHPKCVAELLYPNSETQALHFEQHVAGGLEFQCPMHNCCLCKKAAKDDKKMQFAVCRRCPTAYHRKCLPSDISFEEDEVEGTPQRAWDKVLPDRILIYCMKHKIHQKLGTPKRDHIVFPDARNPFSAKRPKCASTEQNILHENELLDRPSSKPSHPPQPAETGHHWHFSPKPIDSFAPKHLFQHPQPGSCGWLDD